MHIHVPGTICLFNPHMGPFGQKVGLWNYFASVCPGLLNQNLVYIACCKVIQLEAWHWAQILFGDQNKNGFSLPCDATFMQEACFENISETNKVRDVKFGTDTSNPLGSETTCLEFVLQVAPHSSKIVLSIYQRYIKVENQELAKILI